jgi:hypothetical protein
MSESQQVSTAGSDCEETGKRAGLTQSRQSAKTRQDKTRQDKTFSDVLLVFFASLRLCVKSFSAPAPAVSVTTIALSLSHNQENIFTPITARQHRRRHNAWTYPPPC